MIWGMSENPQAFTPPADVTDIYALSSCGRVKCEWVDLGEGRCGDFDPEDPDDIALLRFDTYVRLGTDPNKNPHGLDPVDDTWGTPRNSSFCTNMPVGTDEATLLRAATCIANELADALDAGHWKTTIEGLSWVCPEDFPAPQGA